jgi:hypothetical protein
MGVGLISLLVAEEKRRQAKSESTLSAKKPEIWEEETVMAHGGAPVLEVVRRNSPRRSSVKNSSYDKDAWRRLVESDSDIADVTSILAEYGEHLVDELARRYLAGVDDKTRLFTIIQSIIAETKIQPSSRAVSGPKVDRHSLASVASLYNDQPNDWSLEDASKVETGPPANEEVSADGVVDKPSIDVVTEEAYVDPSKPSQKRQSSRITSADGQLAELISKFAPDSTFLLKK